MYMRRRTEIRGIFPSGPSKVHLVVKPLISFTMVHVNIRIYPLAHVIMATVLWYRLLQGKKAKKFFFSPRTIFMLG